MIKKYILFLLFSFLLLSTSCFKRNNPVDVKADNFVGEEKSEDADGDGIADYLDLDSPINTPKIDFIDNTISSFVNDTVTITVEWSDIDTVGKEGSIKKFLWDLNGDGTFEKETTSDTLKEPFSADTFMVYVKCIDAQGIESTKDSLKLFIALSPPTITTMPDTTVAINDTVALHVSGSDVNGSVVKYLWSFDNGVSYDTTSDSTYKKVWSVSDTGINRVSVCAVDNDTVLSALDSMNVLVNLYAPTANAGNDTTVGINDNISLHGSGSTDETSIVEYVWKIEDGDWFNVSNGDTVVKAPNTAQTWVCSLKVTDDDGNFTYDVMNVTVETCPPTANAGNDTAVGINDDVALHGSGSSDETSIVEYAWKCGNGDWIVDADGDTVVKAPSVAQSWVCSLKVTDDDGNIAYDAMNVTVETRPPIANAGNDVIVKVNNGVVLHGSGSSDETNIVKYAWKCGDGSWIVVGNGDTTITVPSAAQTWVCSLKVIDDDGNVSYDAVVIDIKISETVFNNASTQYISTTALSNGNFVVAYNDDANSNYGTFVIYDASGNVVKNETVFNNASTYYTSTTTLSNGNFVVAYMDNVNPGKGTFMIYDASGNVVKDETVFNASTQDISTTAFSNGDFMVAYADNGNSYYGTFMIYDTSGNVVKDETVFNNAGTQHISTTILSDGNFVVAYSDWGNSKYGTFVIYDASGNVVKNETVFNNANTEYISATTLSNGTFIITYTDVGNSDKGMFVIINGD